MKLKIRNQTFYLLAENAIFWEEKKMLILADIHIGKATVFRKAGIAIPEGSMQEDLLKISHLLDKYQAEKCMIVGDLIHAKNGLSLEVRKLFSDWLKAANCEIHLVMGNHDYSLAKELPADWPLHFHKEYLLIEQFYFSHFPLQHPEWFVWAGHIHPKVLIKNRHDQVTLRCFQIFPNLGILPAFGSFVGGAYVKKSSECKIYGIADDTVIKVI